VDKKIGGAYITHGGKGKCKKILLGKPESKKLRRSPKCKLEYNIKIDFW
jgi:hypothetical protein